ncbi:MAG TPA: phosphate regulon transcriptional regulator PhoB [Beijerinckiaceae bacterium]|nr:phosphate regulon transcriptional regulator PhoB [Beijerinckiaceae bacterium]
MTSTRILIVEDEADLALLISYNLKAEGFAVEAIGDGAEAALRLSERLPDLLLLDWMLPGLSGIELCRRLRQAPETRTLPIIMLTARGEEPDRVRGLETGADDYLVKPFSMPELMARIRSLLRRSHPERIADRLIAGDIELDRQTRRVSRAGEAILFGPTEFQLLDVLMSRPGRVFDRQRLITEVWGEDAEIEDRTIDVHIGRLRRALNRGDEADPLRTVRGVGYSFDETYGRTPGASSGMPAARRLR